MNEENGEKEKESRIMSSSVHRSQKNLKELVLANAWMFRKPMGKKIPPLLITVTFEKNITNLTYANKEHSKFMQRLNYELFNTKKMKLAYLSVPQFQERGAVHYHIAIFNMPFVKNRVFTTLRRIWGHGKFVNLKKINNAVGIYKYLRRYMQKNFDDSRLKGRNKYLRGRSLLRPIILRDDKAIEMILWLLPDNSYPPYVHSFSTPYAGTMEITEYYLKPPKTIFDLPLDPYARKAIELAQSKNKKPSL